MAEKWKVDLPGSCCIKAEDGQSIGFMTSLQRATQVIREHNSHKALVDACNGLLKISSYGCIPCGIAGLEGRSACEDCHIYKHQQYTNAALALAKEA